MPPRPKPPQLGPLRGADDLESLRAIDAAESRAKAAMSLAHAAEHRADIAEQKAEMAALRYDEGLLQRAADAPSSMKDRKSMRPGLHIAGRGWKLGVPFTALVAAVPLLWALVQQGLALEEQVKDLNKAVAGFQASVDATNKMVSDNTKDISGLHTTVALTSGYLARVLPMAGVSVPGAELGALPVDIDRDPAPLGVTQKPRVVTHTRVPAPAPLQ